MNLSEKILYNVLKQIRYRQGVTAAPDREYTKALETIGLINNDWNGSLTDMGEHIFQYYDNILSNQTYNGR